MTVEFRPACGQLAREHDAAVAEMCRRRAQRRPVPPMVFSHAPPNRRERL